MPKVNYGKKFESIIKDCLDKLQEDRKCYALRLYDTTNGFKNIANPCDFIINYESKMIMLECKSCHGASIPRTNISDFQFKSLEEVNDYAGIIGGYLIWFIDKDTTVFINGTKLMLHFKDNKSLNYQDALSLGIEVKGTKKRVFFEYDFLDLLDKIVEKR